MFLRIGNAPRDYTWGSHTALSDALGTPPSGAPEAELWLGTHPADPAELIDVPAPGGPSDLRDFVQRHPLPDGSRELPFLLKLLAAEQPLSLQAHPTKEQAQIGFAREEAAGIPRDAAERNYKDANHKPELIVAVSDRFEALSGFRPMIETLTVLRAFRDAGEDAALDVSALTAFLAQLEAHADDEAALSWALRWLLTERAARAVAQVVERVSEIASSRIATAERDTVQRIAVVYGADPGVILALFLHRVSLARGEALFLPAGNLHAYLEGCGVELMAASDNVLRGGLTRKHVDVPELNQVVIAKALPAPRLPSTMESPGVQLFAPEGADFELRHISTRREVAVDLPGPSILLNLGEKAQLAGALSQLSLGRGESVYIDSQELPLAVTGEDIFIASGWRPE